MPVRGSDDDPLKGINTYMACDRLNLLATFENPAPQELRDAHRERPLHAREAYREVVAVLGRPHKPRSTGRARVLAHARGQRDALARPQPEAPRLALEPLVDPAQLPFDVAQPCRVMGALVREPPHARRAARRAVDRRRRPPRHSSASAAPRR